MGQLLLIGSVVKLVTVYLNINTKNSFKNRVIFWEEGGASKDHFGSQGGGGDLLGAKKGSHNFLTLPNLEKHHQFACHLKDKIKKVDWILIWPRHSNKFCRTKLVGSIKLYQKDQFHSQRNIWIFYVCNSNYFTTSLVRLVAAGGIGVKVRLGTELGKILIFLLSTGNNDLLFCKYFDKVFGLVMSFTVSFHPVTEVICFGQTQPHGSLGLKKKLKWF